MNVPNLKGTWQQRNAQLYKMLGSPMGAYKGNLQQNLYLLDQLKKNDMFKGGLPGQQQVQQAAPVQQAPAQATVPVQTFADIAAAYTKAFTKPIEANSSIPEFQNVVDFQKAWNERLAPGATLAAQSQIYPEAQRDFKQASRDYTMGMVSGGGQRFGRGLSGLGSLKASSERNAQNLLNQMVGMQKEGTYTNWFKPSADSWNKARTSGMTPDSSLTNIPDWDAYAKKYDVYGAGQGSSLLYG